MKTYRKPIAALILAVLAVSAAPAGAADPKPPTNDFIVRAPSTEINGIAARNGLTVISEIAAAIDEDGHSLYLMRAASGTPAETVIQDIETLEPAAAGIEEVVLASLPKLNQSTAVILDTSAVDSALGAIDGFDAPSATISASWNGHEHDREIEAGNTEKLEFTFESAAGTDPASYTLGVDFTDGSSATYDPASCQVLLEQAVGLGGQDGKWRVVNTSAGIVTLDSLAVAWPSGNGDLIEVKLDGAAIYNQSLAPASATIASGWLDTVDKRQINPGASVELKLKWFDSADLDALAYTLSIDTAEGHSVQFDPAGGACVSHVDDLITVSGAVVRFDVTNFGSADRLIDSVTITWPAANGKLMTAELHDDSLLDVPYDKFAKDAAGQDRLIWTGYLNQPATLLLELDPAQSTFRGDATVAIIDTGIDPNHPLLVDRVVPGYDFVSDVAGSASEMADLDQSTAVILDQSTAVILDQSTAVILDQSTAVILDQSTAVILDTNNIPPTFGHGTMVAGVIHRAAPEAKLMPLKAFDANGHASLYDIVDAIYYAVDNGANVINMSFSLETFSPELMRAINYAARNGVACVASAGNLGEETLVFPAAFGNTLGIASSDDADELSAFSNWGSDLVTVAAPGENIVTTFPGGRWAVATGTSFSAPWVSGAVALFADKLGTKHAPGLADYYLSSYALAEADPVSGDGQGRSGHGRANLRKAVERVKSGRYASNRPLGTYTITASFAEGCTASYPPPSSGGGCTVNGANQLKFDGKKVLWVLGNESEIDVTLDSLTIAWETDNGALEKIKIDGASIDETIHPAASTSISSGWLETPDERTWAPHETLEILFEFEHDVIWTY